MGCLPAPRAGCIVAGRATFSVNEKVAGRESLKLVLRELVARVGLAVFGDPVAATTRYDVCIHDSTGTLLADLTVARAGQQCGTRPCWRAAGATGYRYADRTSSADGVGKIILRGGDSGKGSVTLKGGNQSSKGQTALPTGIAAALHAPNSHPIVQVVTDDAGCFEAAITTVTRSTEQQFIGKIP